MFDQAEILTELRESLPVWVVWMPVVARTLLALLGGILCARLGEWIALRPYRRFAGDSWTENARLAYPGRATSMLQFLLLPLFLVGGPYLLAAHTSMYVNICPLSPRVIALVGLGVLLPYLSNARRQVFNQTVNDPVSPTGWLRGQLLYWLLFIPHVLIALAVLVLAHDAFDAWTICVLAGGVLLFVFLISGGGLFLARWLGLLGDASQRVRDIVERCSQRVGVVPKTVYELRWYQTNAIAFPFQQSIGFTDRLVREFDDSEIEAICSHELGHLSEPKSVLFARGSVPTLVVLLPIVRPLFGTIGILGVYAVLAAMFVLLLLIKNLARRMEQRADEIASEGTEDSALYAETLMKIYRLNGMPAVMPTDRMVHPHLYDRMLAAGVEPDFPRPARPSRKRTSVAVFCSSTLALTLWLGFIFTPILAVAISPKMPVAYAAIAVGGGSTFEFDTIAMRSFDADERHAEILAWRVLSVSRSERWEGPANLARAYAEFGRCEEARRALAESRARLANLEESEISASELQYIKSVQQFVDYQCAAAKRQGSLK